MKTKNEGEEEEKKKAGPENLLSFAEVTIFRDRHHRSRSYTLQSREDFEGLERLQKPRRDASLV